MPSPGDSYTSGDWAKPWASGGCSSIMCLKYPKSSVGALQGFQSQGGHGLCCSHLVTYHEQHAVTAHLGRPAAGPTCSKALESGAGVQQQGRSCRHCRQQKPQARLSMGTLSPQGAASFCQTTASSAHGCRPGFDIALRCGGPRPWVLTCALFHHALRHEPQAVAAWSGGVTRQP